MCHTWAKEFSDSNFNEAVIEKYQFFTKLPQIPHIHINRNFFKYICNFLDQLLHPYKFHGRDM